MCKGFQGFVDQYNSGFNLHDEENSSTLENTGAVFVCITWSKKFNYNHINTLHQNGSFFRLFVDQVSFCSTTPDKVFYFIKAGCPVLLLQFL